MGKFKSFIEKFKKNILIYLVVWVILTILLVAPVTYTYTQARLSENSFLQEVILHIVDNFLKFPISTVFESEYIVDYINGIKYFALIYWIIVAMAIYKTLPKSAFDKIEHGSSDWCLPGEQYRILSKKNGLILAKDNYLPINKTGDVNVLIVGRFRFW